MRPGAMTLQCWDPPTGGAYAVNAATGATNLARRQGPRSGPSRVPIYALSQPASMRDASFQVKWISVSVFYSCTDHKHTTAQVVVPCSATTAQLPSPNLLNRLLIRGATHPPKAHVGQHLCSLQQPITPLYLSPEGHFPRVRHTLPDKTHRHA